MLKRKCFIIYSTGTVHFHTYTFIHVLLQMKLKLTAKERERKIDEQILRYNAREVANCQYA